MRSRYCRVCTEFHDLSQAWPSACMAHFGDQGETGPHIIRDTMDPIRSMASGRFHDSKSAYRNELRSMGCREVGNDKVERSRTAAPPVRDSMRQSIRQLGG